MGGFGKKIGEIGLAGAMMLSPEMASAQNKQQAPEKPKQELKADTANAQLDNLFQKHEELCKKNAENERKAARDPVYQGADTADLREMFERYANMYESCSDSLKSAKRLFNSFQSYLVNPANKDRMDSVRLEANVFRTSLDFLKGVRRTDKLEDRGRLTPRANLQTVQIDDFINDVIAFSEKLQAEFDSKGLSSVAVKISKN